MPGDLVDFMLDDSNINVDTFIENSFSTLFALAECRTGVPEAACTSAPLPVIAPDLEKMEVEIYHDAIDDTPHAPRQKKKLTPEQQKQKNKAKRNKSKLKKKLANAAKRLYMEETGQFTPLCHTEIQVYNRRKAKRLRKANQMEASVN